MLILTFSGSFSGWCPCRLHRPPGGRRPRCPTLYYCLDHQHRWSGDLPGKPPSN